MTIPTLGQKLRAAREAAGLSRRQLSEQMRVDQSCLSAWERGERVPLPQYMIEAARVLRVDVDSLDDRLNRDGTDAMTCTIEELGVAIREARIAAGLSRGQLAECIGVAIISIRTWELGHRAPSYKRSAAVAAVLGLDVKMFPRCPQPRTTVYKVLPGKTRVGTDTLGRAVWRRIEDPREKLFGRAVAGPDGCIVWTGGKSDRGYGHVEVNGVRHYTHRLAYELVIGPIPDGLELDHLCHTRDQSCLGGNTCPHRRCCNPYHLEPVTTRENSRRGAHARRTHCPQGHEYTPENTRIRLRTDKRGRSITSRECVECNRRRSRDANEVLLNRTHCSAGHELTPENTLWRSDGARWCRTCREDSAARNSGEANRLSRLTWDDVAAIRLRLQEGLSHTAIARSLGVSRTTVSNVANGKAWKAQAGVPEPDELLARHRTRLAELARAGAA